MAFRLAARVWRILAGVAVAIIFIPMVMVVTGYVWLKTGMPAYSGTLRLQGISAPIEVLWDGNAVPHIYAASMKDAYFALGFLHARDRLWQMETQRRIGQGRFAEIVGTPALRFDRYLRTLGIYRLAQEDYRNSDPALREALDTYAAGVNTYLRERTDPLPIEFQLFWVNPEPWQPADSLVWGKLMALQLVGNSRGEMLRAQLLRRLGTDQVDDLFPGPDPTDPVTLADIRKIDWGKLAAAVPVFGPATASNEWVVAGQHTATGKPILANDPHLALNAPILWYLARIVTPELSLTGATVPGVPLHVLGHNGRIAWGFTTTGTDVQDLYIEKTDPADPRRYQTPTGPAPFTTREELIRVRFGEDLRLTVRETRHGPVVSDIDERAKEAAGPGNAIALAFTALSERDTTSAALYRLNRARNWSEFRDALRLHQAPQQNIVYADLDGNIGFIAPARVPIRSRGDGRIPVPGWTDEYAWIGYIPFDELPQTFNPSDGRIVNANNAIVGPAYPYFLTKDWEEPYRAERIRQMLDRQSAPYTVEAAEQMMTDSVSLAAGDLLPLMLVAQSDRPASRHALDMLRDWDGSAARGRPEPLVFSAWLRALSRALYADELGPMADDFGGLQPRTVKRMLSEKTGWCDEVNTPQAEDCAEMLRRSLDGAIEDLVKRHGEDIASWRWGDEHRAPFNHTPISFIPVLRDLLGISIDTDGDNYTVNRGAFYGDGQTPFAHRHGAGYRAAYDLANLDNSRFIIATGQSGNPLSPHYADLVERWRDGGHVTITGSKQELINKGLGRLVLEPKSAP